LLVFSNDTRRRRHLLHFSSWIEGGSGITTAVRILEGEGARMLKLKEEAEAELRADIENHGAAAFPLVLVASDLHAGVQTLIQGFGVGPLKVNTILLNWLEELPKGMLGIRELCLGRHLRAAFRLGSNIVVLDAGEDEWAALERLSSRERQIHVWWWGDATSRLMLLLAYLMTRSEAWDGAQIRVLAAGCQEDAEINTEALRKTLEDVRIEAEPEIVVKAKADAIADHSANAALVFLPFRLRGNELMDPFGGQLEALLSRLPIVAMVLAAEDIELDAEPEEGKPGEVAAALDALADAENRARKTEKEAGQATELADEKLREVQAARASGAGEEEMAKLEAAAQEAKARAEKAARRAARTQAKAGSAARAAEALGVKPPVESDEAEKAPDSDKVQNPKQTRK
jgi:hypothetical protein